MDRGRHPGAATPWDDESWRAAAFAWAGERLDDLGLRPVGPVGVRVRPWSVLVRLPVSGGDSVWFKANPPASRFEGPLTAALSRLAPEHVLRPLAVDAGRGWSLLPDGGTLFRNVPAGETGPRDWETMLGQYARLQRALVPHTAELAALGVPDARLPRVAHLYDELRSGVAPDPGVRATLDALRPRVADWCAELAALGVPDSLDHADLHDGQIFRPVPGRFTFFDWGDANLSHPFCVVRVAARTAAERYGDRVVPRLLDAYLEPWTGTGRSITELRRAAGLAWRVAALGRALAWGRVFPDPSGVPPLAEHTLESLRAFGEEPPY
ncbi:aminoglycoside phosphotransferase family protein [Streptomyces sp. J2-1]|nr:aminoglycoside phosphotransferase family protein [Streptomyces corallincola]